MISKKSPASLSNGAYHYKPNITAGGLFVPESRKIAELMLREVTMKEWKNKIEDENILQKLSRSSAKRIASYIRSRFKLMGPELWKLVKDGDSVTAAHACLAAAIKHCKILGDYLFFVVHEQFRRLEDRLTPLLWEDFILGCRQRDPGMKDFSPSVAKKMRSNVHKILKEAGYLTDSRKWILQKTDISPDVIDYLKKNREDYVLRCIRIPK